MAAVLKYFKLSKQERLLFLEAVFFLFAAKITLLIFSFKRIVTFISKKEVIGDKTNRSILPLIKQALARANRISFWKNKCIVQSLAARWMLQRRNIKSELSLGVKQNSNKKLMAHAWIKVDDFEIVNTSNDYKELFSIR